MKTKDEINNLKVKTEAPNNEFAELTEEELSQVSGGHTGDAPPETVTPSQPLPDFTPKKVELENQISGFMISEINKPKN